MDYEKKYNEALERFKTFRKKYCTYGDLHFGDVIFDKTGEAQKDLDSIFPEFNESENERIRKEILDFIQLCLSRTDFGSRSIALHKEDAEMFEKWIAYLEKQKEQMPVECIKFDNEFENQISHLIASVLNGEHEYSEGFVKYVSQSLLGYAKNEQKLAEVIKSKIGNIHPDEYPLTPSECVQKPTEWSEEEKIIDTLIWLVEGRKKNRTAAYGDVKIDDILSWLKSLRPQPKQNASDIITPNKRFFKWIYDRLVNVHKENPNVDYMRSFKRRIEELSFDEPHLKINKEQMDALKNVAYGYYQESDRFLLRELYEQLKKLI